MKRFRNVNWGKCDILTPEGEFLWSCRFVMVGQKARIIRDGEVATVEFSRFWYDEGSRYKGEAPDGIWEVVKLRCNCRS